MSKIITLEEAVKLVNNGDTVTFGGNVMQRSPLVMAKALAKAGKQDLRLIKTAVAYEADILAASGCLKKVYAGFAGYETEFGLCTKLRKAIEQCEIEYEEHACYTVIAAMRAAAYGLDFIPVKGMKNSSLPKANGFKTVSCPYTGTEYIAIKAIKPDIAFIHVQKADIQGNARIIGPKYEDALAARAAKNVILTCEEITDSAEFTKNPEFADIPSVLTDYVVHLPGGAFPGACPGYYDIDAAEVKRFIRINDKESLLNYLEGKDA